MNVGKVVGEKLVFPPEPLVVRISAIAFTVLWVVLMGGGFALMTLVLLYGLLQSLRRGQLGEVLLTGGFAAFTGWLDYWAVRMCWAQRADCFPCELVIDRQRQQVLSVFRGDVMNRVSFGRADWLMCQYSQGIRGARFYTIVAGSDSQRVMLYSIGPWTDEVVKAVQEKSIAISEFLDLPLKFVGLEGGDFLEEPGASYNRKMANRTMANRTMTSSTQPIAAAVKIECPSCSAEVSVAEVLAGASKYWSVVRAALHCRFPCCGAINEAQLMSEKISMGYLYAAGTAHFCGMVDYEVPGMTVARCENGLKVYYQGQAFLIPSVEK